MKPLVSAETDRLIRTADFMIEVYRVVTGDSVRAALHQFRFESESYHSSPTSRYAAAIDLRKMGGYSSMMMSDYSTVCGFPLKSCVASASRAVSNTWYVASKRNVFYYALSTLILVVSLL